LFPFSRPEEFVNCCFGANPSAWKPDRFHREESITRIEAVGPKTSASLSASLEKLNR
jgi:hypothetical protein